MFDLSLPVSIAALILPRMGEIKKQKLSFLIKGTAIGRDPIVAIG